MNNDARRAEQDKAAIRTLLDEVVTALNKGDLEKLLSLHTDDFILMEQNMPLMQGKQRIREMFADFERSKRVHKIDFQTRELEVTGTRAFVRGSVMMTQSEAGNTPQHHKGKFICLLQKQPDDRWLRTHVIVNTDGPAG